MRADKMKEAKVKAGNYCAYQERTQQEVRDKLYSLGLHRDEVEEVLADLITEDFVNEERFAKTYAGSKFRMNQWGRVKIGYMLKRKGLSQYCIDKALNEIREGDYISTIERLIEKRIPNLSEANLPDKQKTANFLIGKGFEPSIVWSILKE